MYGKCKIYVKYDILAFYRYFNRFMFVNLLITRVFFTFQINMNQINPP